MQHSFNESYTLAFTTTRAHYAKVRATTLYGSLVNVTHKIRIADNCYKPICYPHYGESLSNCHTPIVYYLYILLLLLYF